MRKTRYGEFKGKRLLVGDDEVEVNYLRGRFGEKVLKEVYHRFRRVLAFQQLECCDGSNRWSKTDPWTSAAVNQVLIEEGLGVSRLRETSSLVESDILDETIHQRGSTRNHQYFRDEHYTSLVLQPKKMFTVPEVSNLASPPPIGGKFTEQLREYNNLLYEKLMKQILEKIGRIEAPVLINLSDLRLDASEKNYAFFNLAEDAEIIPVSQFSTKDSSPIFNNTNLETFEKSFYRTDIETGLPKGCYERRASKKARRLCLSDGGVNELYLFNRDFHINFLGFHSLGKASGKRSGLAKITVVDELK